MVTLKADSLVQGLALWIFGLSWFGCGFGPSFARHWFDVRLSHTGPLGTGAQTNAATGHRSHGGTGSIDTGQMTNTGRKQRT